MFSSMSETSYMKSVMIKFLVTTLILLLALLTGSIFMQKSMYSKNTAIDLFKKSFVSNLHDGKNSSLGLVAERTATVSIAENNNSNSLINTNDGLEYDLDSQKSVIASKTLRPGKKQINKRSETILRDKFSEVVSKKDSQSEDNLYFRNSEFNEYPNRTSYRFNTVLPLFLPKESEMASRIAIVCINSFYDIEDEYNIVLVSGRYPGKPYREYATYQNEIDIKLKTMDLEQKLLYFLRKALWCDNMLIQDHYIRRINDKVIKVLCDGYEYLQQRKSRSKYRKVSYLHVCDDY